MGSGKGEIAEHTKVPGLMDRTWQVTQETYGITQLISAR